MFRIFCIVLIFLILCVGGCQAGIHGAVFYPEKGWSQGGDPADSRAAAQGINPNGFRGMNGGDK